MFVTSCNGSAHQLSVAFVPGTVRRIFLEEFIGISFDLQKEVTNAVVPYRREALADSAQVYWVSVRHSNQVQFNLIAAPRIIPAQLGISAVENPMKFEKAFVLS